MGKRMSGVCVHCNAYSTNVVRKLCPACYTYERRHGEPRPYRLMRGPVSDEEFDLEWEFMQEALGREGAMYRLKNAYEFTHDVLLEKIRGYNERHMHSSDVRVSHDLLDR